jgi:hypothetical protein
MKASMIDSPKVLNVKTAKTPSTPRVEEAPANRPS